MLPFDKLLNLVITRNLQVYNYIYNFMDIMIMIIIIILIISYNDKNVFAFTIKILNT